MNKHEDARERDAFAVDSTQTLRALTPQELGADQQQKWFAIQLAVSDQPPNLDIMPRFDIFASHRLYKIVARHDTTARHALRLGFFDDMASAAEACDYLKKYFAEPSVVRVSAAERARFVPRPPAATLQNSEPRAESVVHFSPKHVDAALSSAPASRTPPPSARSSVPEALPILRPSVRPRALAAGGVSQRLTKKTRSLAEELLEEARGIQRSKRRKTSTTSSTGSWLARLFGTAKT